MDTSPSSDADATVTEIPGLTVAIASPRHLLAMKMVAFRTIDRSDLVRLFDRLHIQTPEEAADIVDEVYGVDNLANPGREESILSARSVLAAAKATPRPARHRSSGHQGRATDGRFAQLHRDEATFQLDDQSSQD